jgi:hypothetical protein
MRATFQANVVPWPSFGYMRLLAKRGTVLVAVIPKRGSDQSYGRASVPPRMNTSESNERRTSLYSNLREPDIGGISTFGHVQAMDAA